MQKGSLLLNRDGVINVSHDYVQRQEKFEFIGRVFDLARAAHVQQYILVVTTNKGRIARGFYAEQQFQGPTEGLAAGVGCNILFAQENLAELTSTNYKRISTLRYALPFLNFGASQEVTQ
jgi:hypothetical protein